MSKFDDIKIPKNIDEITKVAVKRGIDYKKKRKYKKIMIASVSTIMVGAGIVGIGINNPALADSVPVIREILDYFSHNNKSLYVSDKDDFEKLNTNLNLYSKDNGIELIIDSISIDDNYITIFQTVKSDKNIKKMNEDYKDAYFANPIVDAYIDGKNISPPGLIEHEATYVSDNELKGMRKIDVSNVDIKNNTEIVFRTNEIFGVEGKWEISANVDKSKSTEESYNYVINKDFTVKKTYDYHDKKVDIKHNINIDKVSISPLASKIIINEKTTKKFNDWMPMMGGSFALFDQNNKSLDIVDKGELGPNSVTGIATNSYDFLKASKDTKSLTLVPISYDDSIKNHMFEPKNIDNLPIVFEMSDYGKLIIEDIQITDKEVKYTYYKDGVVPGYPTLWFYDEDGNELNLSRSVKESLDRHTGRYTTIYSLLKDSDDTSRIKKVSTVNDNDMKLLYDQQIKIDLVKNNDK